MCELIRKDIGNIKLYFFYSFKGALPDGIFSVLVRNEMNCVSTHIVGIYNASLTYENTPKNGHKDSIDT